MHKAQATQLWQLATEETPSLSLTINSSLFPTSNKHLLLNIHSGVVIHYPMGLRTVICLWCITAILLGVVIGFGVPSIKKSNSWKTAIGTIIEVDSCGTNGYTNGVAEYTTANENQFKVNIVCSGFSKEVGDEWEVLYDPSSPDMAVDGSFYNLWTIPLIFLIVSIVWCIASLVFTGKQVCCPQKPWLWFGDIEINKPYY